MISPLLSINFFSIPENFRKTEGFLFKAFRFSPVRQKVPTKPWCPPPEKNFSKTPKCSPKKYFGTVRQKLFDGKSWYPPSYPKNIFPYQKFSETQNDSLAKFFRSCEIKEILTKPWSFPLLCLKIFGPRILSKHRRVLLRILSALWDKNFSTEFSDIPLCIKFCDTRNFLKHRSVPQRNFSVLYDTKFSTEKRDTPLSDA